MGDITMKLVFLLIVAGMSPRTAEATPWENLQVINRQHNRAKELLNGMV